MAETLLRYLWMNAAGEQMRCVCVPQIVEPDVRQALALASSRTHSWVRLFGWSGWPSSCATT